jgi:hypothetical protein
MRVSLQWLRELVQVEPEQLDPQHLAERLSIAGFEVEAIEDLAARARGVVVGYVAAREPHPDADKLSVCQVQVGGGEPLQIVCGAANVRAGIHVPVALVGSTLPAVGLTIKPAELRGVASSGGSNGGRDCNSGGGGGLNGRLLGSDLGRLGGSGDGAHYVSSGGSIGGHRTRYAFYAGYAPGCQLWGPGGKSCHSCHVKN